ncbi:hypothetical protein [Reinekea marinisedimentorum]|nr:hypothetical protein [Reinekea marinisedimentorum]
MLVSRGFLFKIGLLKPSSYPYSLGFNFTGTIYQLLRTRFILSDVSINQIFTAKEQKQNVCLPDDMVTVSQLLESKLDKLTPIISQSADAYRSYLESLGYFESSVNVVDVGYSGSIQKLLTILFGKSTKGHYLIASKPGETAVAGNTVSMHGYLKEGVKLEEGYLPLDRSMFLESLLTAPQGQFQDIRYSALNNHTFDFYFGRKVASQHNFHMLEQICNGALEQMTEYSKKGIEFTVEEVESILQAYVGKKGMFPRHAWPLFSIDDDISNTGTVNAIEFFGLSL